MTITKKIALLFLGAMGLAYGTDCTISDTVRTPFGGYFAGKITVVLNSPSLAQPLYSGSQTLTGWQTTIDVPASANGAVAVTLVCTDSITPSGTSYAARYQPTSGAGWAETWTPATGTTTIRAMRATTVPSPTVTFQPSQIAPGSSGQVLTTSGGAAVWAASSGGVTSLNGTANQITASASTGAVTLSLPATITGLTSVTSTGFTGALTGNASTATALASTLTTGQILFGQGTGVPTSESDLYWDSAANELGIRQSTPVAPLHVGNSTTNGSTDAQILISRLVNDASGTGNGHAFADSSTVSRSGTIGYNSFDARSTVSGSSNYDHYAAFQVQSSHATVGTTTHLYGYFFGPTVSAGSVTNVYGTYITGVNSGSRAVNVYGHYIADQTTGTTSNWAVYAAGTTKSFFGGGVTLGGTTQTTSLPLVDGSQTWNAGGVTFTGLKVNITNTASAAASKVFDFQVNSVSYLSMAPSTGLVSVAGGLPAGGDISGNNWLGVGNVRAGASQSVFFTGRTIISSPANGDLLLWNTGGTDFGLIKLGGITSSFPALKRAGTALQVRLADDSAFTELSAAAFQWQTGTRPTCNSGNRFKVWAVAGGAGVLDTFELCRKDAADAYAWVTLF